MTYSKYQNQKTEVDGFLFDSKAEARRYSELKLLERAGEISDLQLQPKFPIAVNGKLVANYFADFRYKDLRTGEYVVEDVKGARTDVYILKKKLVEAIHDIKIIEIK